MTNKERIVVLTILVSVLGITFFGTIQPVQAVGTNETKVTYSIEKENNNNFYLEYKNSIYKLKESKLINMLSEILSMSYDSVYNALEGGLSPNDLLSDSGLLLSDLTDEYNFEIVHDRFVRFR